MPNAITVTGKTGPGLTETAIVYNNITDLDFNLGSNVLTITHGLVNSRKTEVDLYSIATITYTVSAHVATVAVST